MNDFNAWLNGTAQSEGARAALAWARITNKPSSVAFKTPADVTLAAQTVRLEYDDDASTMTDAGMTGPDRDLIVFGIRNHDTETDTDMKEGYRFVYDSDEYRIIDTILTLGEIQGIAKSMG